VRLEREDEALGGRERIGRQIVGDGRRAVAAERREELAPHLWRDRAMLVRPQQRLQSLLLLRLQIGFVALRKHQQALMPQHRQPPRLALKRDKVAVQRIHRFVRQRISIWWRRQPPSITYSAPTKSLWFRCAAYFLSSSVLRKMALAVVYGNSASFIIAAAECNTGNDARRTYSYTIFSKKKKTTTRNNHYNQSYN
jgi:hypothetical protein